MAQSGELRTLPAFAPEHLAATARFFLDLVVVPMLLRGCSNIRSTRCRRRLART
jgi:hypothetical protein